MAVTSQNGRRTRIQQENRERILKAALDMFSRSGYRGTTLDEIAAGSDHTVGQLAVAWTLRRSEVTSAIVGARRPGQIAETVKAGSWALSAEELTAIEAAHKEFLAATA